MSEPTVPQTRIRAEIRPDGSGVLDVNGTHRHIEPGAFPATRTTIVSHAAEFAAALRRPIGVTIAGADGHWDIVVHPDGSVSDVRQMPADAPTPPPPAPMHVPSAPHPPAASQGAAVAEDARDADAQAPAFGQTGPAPSLTDETIVTHGGDADDDDADAGMTVPRVPSAPRSSESAAQSGDAAAGSFDARAAAEAADAPSETDAADGDDASAASAASGEGAVELPATHEQPHEHAADPAPSPALPTFQPPAVDDTIVSRAPEAPVSSPSLPLQAPIASVPGYDRAAYDPSLDETVARPRSSYAPIASVPSAPASSGRPAATSPFATPTPPASSGAPAAPAAPLASVPSAAAPGQPAASATPVSSAPRTSYAPGELSGPVTADGRHSFLEAAQREQPAQAGLRGAMTRMGIKVAPSEAELAERADERAVSQHWPGPRTIAVVNGKGGAGKTPTTVLLSAVFAQLGGAGVLAWDNNQTRGTLGWRTERGPHDSTLLELLPQAEHLLSAGAQAADLAQFVHHQSQDKYDVLRSKPMRLAHENRIRPDDVDAIHAVASKYYRLIVIDSGNDESDPMWLRMVDHADQIVVATTTRADHAEAGALLLEALGERDERSRILAQRSVVVVSQADPKASRQDVESVIGGYGPLAREVVRIPFDQALVDGHLRLGSLRPETRRAWLGAAAAVARGL